MFGCLRVVVWALGPRERYSGPGKLDKFGGPQVLHWTYHAKAKAVYRDLQSASRAGDA